jgi:hypothetical protein
MPISVVLIDGRQRPPQGVRLQFSTTYGIPYQFDVSKNVPRFPSDIADPQSNRKFLISANMSIRTLNA